MSNFRVLLFFLLSILAGLICVGVLASLPYPYSEFPIIPILFALSLVLRLRPATFWFLFVIIFVADLYRGAGFGVGILSFVALVFVSDKIARDLFSHRSMVGCVVISATSGMFWVLFNAFFSQIAYWVRGGSYELSFLGLVISVAIQSGVTAFIVGIFYALAPRWLRDHSPMIISGRL